VRVSGKLQTVDRALQLIELLRVNHEVTVSGAARMLGVSTSIAHRLLATLEARGFARHTVASRAYCLGPALEGLSPSNTDSDYISITKDQIRKLQIETDETVHLSALSGRHVRFFYTIVSRHIMRVESRVGDLLPAHASSSGRALLATLPRGAVRHLYPDHDLITAGFTTTPTRTALELELEHVRDRGYARNIEETEPGIASLSVTLFGPGRMPPIAIAVTGPQFRLRFEQERITSNERLIAQALMDTVKLLQRRLTPSG